MSCHLPLPRRLCLRKCGVQVKLGQKTRGPAAALAYPRGEAAALMCPRDFFGEMFFFQRFFFKYIFDLFTGILCHLNCFLKIMFIVRCNNFVLMYFLERCFYTEIFFLNIFLILFARML
ncbi:hypothetical protein DPEC_G00206790 [Dallia pectoralis]|uniref:Uncharacterized protein n=1 Tax=Dallia pectoralis TaxID=75939 RepID=A0ACC2G4W8_DALPE|nr:hypothetical protein DPEC_G00206790 [Dallia pectoralis]